jgi:peptidyl-prolyl cis-trans isomerase D
MAQKNTKRYGAWIIVGVVLLGLAGFGTGGLSGNIRNLGSAGDKDVTVAAYQRVLNDQIRSLSAQFGAPVSFQQAQAFGVDRQALAQVVLTRTLDNEAAAMGLSAGDLAVFERISAIGAFQGASGFNRDTYRLVLQQSGQTEAQFEAEIREDLARTLLQGAIVGGVQGPDAAADTLAQYLGERRDVTLVRVTDSALTAPVRGATPADLQAFYDANPDLFMQPETREITYVWMTPAMIVDQVEVTEAAIAALYDQRRSEFVQPERRLVERLVFADSAAATAAAARLAAGDVTFDALVSERGLGLADVDLGDLGRDDLDLAAADAIFAAAPGDVVGPLPSDLGPALFRMNAVLAAQETTLDEATDDLRAELAATAARDVIDQDFDRISDLLAGGASLQDLAAQSDMSLGQISWRPDMTDGIAAYDDFRNAAAAIAIGDFAQLETLSDGGIFALQLDAITPPSVPPLDEIRDAVTSAWALDARKQAVIAQAQIIAADIAPLTDPATLGLVGQAETDLTRRSFVPDTPVDFGQVVFGMKLGETQVLAQGDGALIVRLDAIRAADLQSDDMVAQRQALRDSFAAGIAQDLFDAYAAAIQQSTDITINQATVDAINAQFQ